MAECCGSDIYWCPRAGRFECPTHGGHDVCCDRPERHTPLDRFEVQAKALLRWWQEERQSEHLTDDEIRERNTWHTYQCHHCHADMRACLEADVPCCAGCHHGATIRHRTFSAGGDSTRKGEAAPMMAAPAPPADGAPESRPSGAPNSWSEYMSTVTYCPGCGGMGCDQCGGTGEAAYGPDTNDSTPRGSSFFEQIIAARDDDPKP